MFGYRLIKKRELGRLRAYEVAYREKCETARLYEDEAIRLKKELAKYIPERGRGGRFEAKKR